MDPVRIVVRVVFAYVWVLLMLRLTGRRVVSHGDVPSFVLALVIGDLFDDLFWAEVPASQFVVALGTLVLAHLWATEARVSSGGRLWLRGLRRETR